MINREWDIDLSSPYQDDVIITEPADKKKIGSLYCDECQSDISAECHDQAQISESRYFTNRGDGSIFSSIHKKNAKIINYSWWQR